MLKGKGGGDDREGAYRDYDRDRLVGLLRFVEAFIRFLGLEGTRIAIPWFFFLKKRGCRGPIGIEAAEVKGFDEGSSC